MAHKRSAMQMAPEPLYWGVISADLPGDTAKMEEDNRRWMEQMAQLPVDTFPSTSQTTYDQLEHTRPAKRVCVAPQVQFSIPTSTVAQLPVQPPAEFAYTSVPIPFPLQQPFPFYYPFPQPVLAIAPELFTVNNPTHIPSPLPSLTEADTADATTPPTTPVDSMIMLPTVSLPSIGDDSTSVENVVPRALSPGGKINETQALTTAQGEAEDTTQLIGEDIVRAQGEVEAGKSDAANSK